MLSYVAELDYSTYCRGISKELSLGLDNGDGDGTAADGQLHVDEVDSIEYICPKIKLVKDIFSGSDYGYPSQLTEFGGTLFFVADDGINGEELWKSDGTFSGTMMVTDINSGSGSSSPAYLTAVGNTLYFRANDGTNGYELWKSDGTASGTVMVKDIYSGSDSSYAAHLTAVGNTLFSQPPTEPTETNCGRAMVRP